MRNIVQAELFRVHEDNLLGLLQECRSRLKDDCDIKTHVRFYDETGVFARFIEQAERVAAQRKAVWNAFEESRGLRRWWIDRKSRAIARHSLQIAPQAAQLVHSYLRVLASKKGEIALEVRRGSELRRVRADELHELVETAGCAQRAWLVLYGPGDLLSYEVEMLGTTIGC